MPTQIPIISMRVEPLERRALLSSNGLFGQYFDDANLSQLRMTRQDIAVDFDFGAASPVQPQMSADTFSIRWTGQIQPQFGETYTFHVTADDGVRLWVRGQLLIDRWSPANQLAGDANRDGVVNLNDFNTLASNFGTQSGATWEQGDFTGDGAVNLADFNALAEHFGSTDAFWFEGDFNYDGRVNLQDFNRLASNFGLSAAGPTVTPQDWSALAAAVPEPQALGLACAAITALARRRRRA